MIELERLLALALGELSGDELDQVELHVLSCSSCARTLERLVQLGSATRELLLAGKLRCFVSPALIAQLDALGLISRRYRLAPNQVVPCSVGRDDVYALTELEADLKGVTRLDLLMRREDGEELRVSDVPFDAGSGMAAYIVRSDGLRQLPSTRVQLELLAVDGERDRLIGKYTMDHDAGRQ